MIKQILLSFFRYCKSLKMYFIAVFLCYTASYHKIEEIIESNRKYELIITNRLGGGASVFLENYIFNKKHILILQNYSYGTDFIFSCKNLDNNKIAYVKKDKIFILFNRRICSKIMINNLVTVHALSDILAAVKKSAIPTIFMAHDFYCLCPVYTLCTKNTFCNFEYCTTNHCLNDCNTYVLPHSQSIQHWRKMWEEFLCCVTGIRCFSYSSKELIQRVYSSVPSDIICVVPHDMSYCNFSPIELTRGNLRVGIIGTLTSVPKGSLVVRNFLQYCKNNKIYAYVIGKYPFYYKVYSKYIKYTGKYENDNLQHIIEHAGVNCVLFPSVCPETFSYLISELMCMKMPVVCFDYGAQAEKINSYDKGQICYSQEPKDIYTALVEVSNNNRCDS